MNSSTNLASKVVSKAVADRSRASKLNANSHHS
jgi:hypothetical protein